MKKDALFLGLIAVAAVSCGRRGATDLAPPGATEPVFQQGVNTPLFYENWGGYTPANFVNNIANKIGTNKYVTGGGFPGGTELRTDGGPIGANYVRYSVTQPQQGPVIGTYNGVPPDSSYGAPGPASLVYQFWIREGGRPWEGKIHALYPDGGTRLMLEYAPGWQAYGGGQQTPLNNCFQNKPGAVPAGEITFVWYHDDTSAPNGLGTVFSQTMNYGTGPDRWKRSMNSDGNWHRVTVRSTKGPSQYFASLEMWVDGVKIMEYVGNDPSRCEYGHVPWGETNPVTERTVNLIGLGGPTAFNWPSGTPGSLDYAEIRLWF